MGSPVVPQRTVIEGDVLLLNTGTLTDVIVKGRWFQLVERDATTTDLPVLSERLLAHKTRVYLDNLPYCSDLEVGGDLYFHPSARLCQEGSSSFLAFDLVCMC